MRKNISRYKDIVWYRATASLKAETRANYLGYLWFLLEPLLNTAAFYIIFGVLQGNRGMEYIVFLLLGTTTWQWFDSGVMGSLHTIKAKVGILNCYALPKSLFPIVHLATISIKFFFAFGIVVVFAAFAQGGPSVTLFYLPIVILTQALVVVGVALPLTLLVTRINDAAMVIGAFMRIFFFLSGVFFGAARIPEKLQTLFYLNPMAGVLESYRLVVMQHQAPNWFHLGWAAGCGSLLIVLGLYLLKRVDKTILKSIAP